MVSKNQIRHYEIKKYLEEHISEYVTGMVVATPILNREVEWAEVSIIKDGFKWTTSYQIVDFFNEGGSLERLVEAIYYEYRDFILRKYFKWV